MDYMVGESVARAGTTTRGDPEAAVRLCSGDASVGLLRRVEIATLGTGLTLTRWPHAQRMPFARSSGNMPTQQNGRLANAGRQQPHVSR